MKSETIKIRITSTLKNYIKEKAESQNHTMSSYIVAVVKRHFLEPGEENFTLPKNSEVKKDVVLIRITPEFKAELQTRAEQENRTMSNYIVTVLQRNYYAENPQS